MNTDPRRTRGSASSPLSSAGLIGLVIVPWGALVVLGTRALTGMSELVQWLVWFTVDGVVVLSLGKFKRTRLIVFLALISTIPAACVTIEIETRTARDKTRYLQNGVEQFLRDNGRPPDRLSELVPLSGGFGPRAELVVR